MPLSSSPSSSPASGAAARSERDSARLVVMGVAGCGKTTVGRACAQALRAPMVEGDDHHTASNRAKMRAGVPLTDDDRADWLQCLGTLLAAAVQRDGRAVLTCSALRRRYRDGLRAALPGLRFVFLDVDEATARARVDARGDHLFPASLVTSQFATLERPDGEAGVLTVAADGAIDDIVAQVLRWLDGEERT